MRIDIWSDIACPWCYIGLTRFERVLADFEHGDEVEVRLRSFQLDPTLPEFFDGTETEYLSQRKGLPEEQVRAMFGQIEQVAAGEGLQPDLAAVKVANSWRSHRLLHVAEKFDPSGRTTRKLELALMDAHFRDGEVISDPATLLRIAQSVGLPLDDARIAVEEEGGALDEAVRSDVAEARSLGIQGVPFFVLAGKYGISGAQPADVMAGALSQVWQELHPAPKLAMVPGLVPATGDDAQACGPEGCD